jgi:hypothetical protein
MEDEKQIQFPKPRPRPKAGRQRDSDIYSYEESDIFRNVPTGRAKTPRWETLPMPRAKVRPPLKSILAERMSQIDKDIYSYEESDIFRNVPKGRAKTPQWRMMPQKGRPLPDGKDPEPQKSSNPRLGVLGVERPDVSSGRKKLSKNVNKEKVLKRIFDPAIRDYVASLVPMNSFVLDEEEKIDNIYVNKFVEICFGDLVPKPNKVFLIGQLTKNQRLGTLLRKGEENIKTNIVIFYHTFWSILRDPSNPRKLAFGNSKSNALIKGINDIRIFVGIAIGPRPQIYGVEIEWFIPFLFAKTRAKRIFILVEKNYKVKNLYSNLLKMEKSQIDFEIRSFDMYKAILINKS